MKYLKHYKLFTSSDIKYNIEEAFYNISDTNFVKIEDLSTTIVKFTTPIMSIGNQIFDFNRIYNIDNVNSDHSIIDQDLIRVLIKKNNNLDLNLNNIIDFESIKDDIQFAIDYLSKEFNLNLVQIYIYRKDNGFYAKNLLYKDFKTLLNDDKIKDSLLSIALYFILI